MNDDMDMVPVIPAVAVGSEAVSSNAASTSSFATTSRASAIDDGDASPSTEPCMQSVTLPRDVVASFFQLISSVDRELILPHNMALFREREAQLLLQLQVVHQERDALRQENQALICQRDQLAERLRVTEQERDASRRELEDMVQRIRQLVDGQTKSKSKP